VTPADVVAVVIAYNGAGYLEPCVRSLLAAGAGEVVVADNGSVDGSIEALAALRLERVRIVPTGANHGVGGGANRGAAGVHGRPVLVSNQDLVVEEGALDALVKRLDEEPDLGIVGPRLHNTDGSVYVSGRPFPSMADAFGHAFLGLFWQGNPWSRRYLLTDWDRDVSADVDWISGAFMLVRAEVWEELGGFDERFFMFMEDVDLCWRAHRAGWRVAIEPAAEVMHHIGTARARHPYRMVAEHHRSMWRWSRMRFAGWRTWLLGPVAVALVVRALLVMLAVKTGRSPDRPETAGAAHRAPASPPGWVAAGAGGPDDDPSTSAPPTTS
jgi:N-acetylglucosaminyl-diphospho-decaprenol L-rhamnosyltransferase